MICINCPKTALISTHFHQKTINGIYFEVVAIQGFSIILQHDTNDEEAKQTVKQATAQMKELKHTMVTVRIVDEQGAIV